MKKKYFLLIGIITFLIVLALDLYTDLRLGDKIDHQRGAFLRALGLLFPLIFFTLYKEAKGWLILIVGFLSCVVIGFNYLNLFDGFYNIFRGHWWFFTGSEDGAGDAKTDNFFQAIPIWAQAVIKIGGSIASIIIYLFTFKNKQT